MSNVFRLSVRLSVRQPRCNPGFRVRVIIPTRVCQIVITLHDTLTIAQRGKSRITVSHQSPKVKV